MADDEYDLKPVDKKPESTPPPRPKPGDPDWVPPTPIIEPADSEPAEEAADPDVANNKAMAILAYILFVIPLVAAQNSKFAHYHANQGLLVFILWCITIVVIGVLHVGWAIISGYAANGRFDVPFLRFMFGCACDGLVPLALFVLSVALTIAGIIHAANGEKKPLPLIGHWTLIK